MPRRGSVGGGRRPTMPARTTTPPPPPTRAAAEPRQPSLFGQMAATAGGVAIGSAVGHVVGSALSGSNSQPETVVAQQPPAQGMAASQNPCQQHIDDLIRCSTNQSDLGLCTGFSEALKECRKMYNMY